MAALDGVRVLDLGVLIQVPQAAATLCDWGADVIKIEQSNVGDPGRLIPIDPQDLRSPLFAAFNRGKRSVTLDLHVAEAREVFLRLVDNADVVLANFTPGRMEEWGLGYDDLSARNPRIIYAAGSAYGEAGPDARREGVDINVQAAGGLISTIGVDGGDASPVGFSIVDHIASQNLVAGILAALYVRERTGRGQRVAGSLLGGQIWAQATEYTSLALSGRVPGRANWGHPLVYGIYGVFPTADGWIALTVRPPRDVFYAVIGRSELDEQYPQLLYSVDDKKTLFPIIAEALAAQSTSEWCEVFDAIGVRCAPVRTHAEVMADSGAWENGYLVTADGPNGPVTIVPAPVNFSDTPACPPSTPPDLGQHTHEILLELGYHDDDIAYLRALGAI